MRKITTINYLNNNNLKKYFKTKAEANKAKKELDPNNFNGLHVFKMRKGTRKSGCFAVCTEMDYLNTY